MENEKRKIESKKRKKSLIVLLLIAISIVLVVGYLFWKVSTDKSYEIETITEFSYFKVYENEKYGVMDAQGRILVEPQYDMLEIPNPSKAIFIGYSHYDSQKGQYQTEVINEKNEKILTQYTGIQPLMFKDASAEVPYEKSVLIYQENDKYGVIDFQGKKITDAIYDSIESLLYKEGCLLVKQEGKYGVINIKGKQIVEIAYDSITADGYYNSETKYKKAGFIVGEKKEEGYRYGYIASNGQAVLGVEYNEIDRITEIAEENEEVYLLVFKNGQAGVYNNKKQIIKNNYEEIEYSKQNQLFLVQKSGKQGVLNKEGNEIIKVEYDYIMIEEQSIHAQKEGTTYHFDLQGKEQENKNHKTLLSTPNSNYFISIDEQDKFGITDKEENSILENEYSYIEYAFGDYFIITKKDSVTVIDAKNKEQVVTGYDVIQKIENKNVIQAILTKPYTIVIYNEKMEEVVSMQEANLKVEKNNIKLTSKTERMYFDAKGNKIEYQEIMPNLSFYAFKEKGRWGFKDKEGKIIHEAEYDMVTELNEHGFAGIKKNDKWGVINSEGTVIVEPSYEIEWEEPEFIGPYCKLNFGYGMVYYTKELKEK